VRSKKISEAAHRLPDWFSGNINMGCLATSGELAAFRTIDGQIFLSNDAGLALERIASNLASIHYFSLLHYTITVVCKLTLFLLFFMIEEQ
jgi:hypothetical protein